MDKDYYNILGAARGATDKELKSLYRKLSLQYHPDRQAGKTDSEKKAAEEKFKEINEAYSVLSDPDKRRQYDQFGTVSGAGADFSGFNPMDFFRKMHGGFGSMFGDFAFGFGGEDEEPSPPPPDRPENGQDIQVNAGVSFRESVFGCTKEFDLPLDKECAECHGTGHARGATPERCSECGGSGRTVKTIRRGFMTQQTISPCQSCGGTGWKVTPCKKCGGAKRVPEKRRIKVVVPAGAYTGMRLRLKGLGPAGVNGGSNGDLYIGLICEESDVFGRDGNDLLVTAHVSPTVAALGGNVDIPTPYGWKKMKLDPGTAKQGQRIRLRGFGIKAKDRTGDMIVTVEIEPWTNLTQEQRAILERMRGTETASNFTEAKRERAKADAFLKQ